MHPEGSYAKAVTGQQPSAQAPTPIGGNPSFLDPLGVAGETVAELVRRLRALSDRLVGSGPPEPGNAIGKLSAIPNGLFEEAASRARTIADLGSEGHELLARIERALP